MLETRSATVLIAKAWSVGARAPGTADSSPSEVCGSTGTSGPGLVSTSGPGVHDYAGEGRSTISKHCRTNLQVPMEWAQNYSSELSSPAHQHLGNSCSVQDGDQNGFSCVIIFQQPFEFRRTSYLRVTHRAEWQTHTFLFILLKWRWFWPCFWRPHMSLFCAKQWLSKPGPIAHRSGRKCRFLGSFLRHTFNFAVCPENNSHCRKQVPYSLKCHDLTSMKFTSQRLF